MTTGKKWCWALLSGIFEVIQTSLNNAQHCLMPFNTHQHCEQMLSIYVESTMFTACSINITLNCNRKKLWYDSLHYVSRPSRHVTIIIYVLLLLATWAHFKSCCLCVEEKINMKSSHKSLLNKRSEMFAKCHHKKEFTRSTFRAFSILNLSNERKQ